MRRMTRFDWLFIAAVVIAGAAMLLPAPTIARQLVQNVVLHVGTANSPTAVAHTSGVLHGLLQAGDADVGNVDVEFAGTAASTNAGAPDAATQRVFLAQRATYTAATTAKTATAAGTGPFFSICGSATKNIRVLLIRVSGTVGTAAVYGDVTIRKTSTATSSGTATALTKVPHDPDSAASTVGLLNFYTVLATAGNLVGTVGAQGAVFPITGTVAAALGYVVFDWMNRQESEAPVLQGTGQCLEAGFGTTTTNAPTLQIEVVWTEE